jgi:hypothetical protein
MPAGGCYCGAVRYETDGEVFHRTLCHCTDCRRVSGAPAVAWFSVARTALRFTHGAPAQFHSSAGVTRGFCAQCGTQLTYARDDTAGEIDITTCSLDDPQAAAPEDHTFVRSRLAWLHTGDGLPEYPATRAESSNPGGAQPDAPGQ